MENDLKRLYELVLKYDWIIESIGTTNNKSHYTIVVASAVGAEIELKIGDTNVRGNRRHGVVV